MTRGAGVVAVLLLAGGCASAPAARPVAPAADDGLVWAPELRDRTPPRPALEPLPTGPTVDHLREHREAAWARHRLRCEAKGMKKLRAAEVARAEGRSKEAHLLTVEALLFCTDFLGTPDYVTDELMRHAGWERLAHFLEHREEWELALRCWERSEPTGHHCVGDGPEAVRSAAIDRCRAKLAR